jgi:hypothetical protein
LLHQHITDIPRWLDEGLCQWASGGIDEIIYNRKQAVLNRASITGNFIPLANLHSAFPVSETARILAYEQSKNFVTFIARQFGEEKLLDFLDRMAAGNTAAKAFYKVYHAEIEQMESTWRNSISKDYNWFTYISYHLYELLFVSAALLTIIGFLKLVRKKQLYKDEDMDE